MKLSELRHHIEEQIICRFGFNGVEDLDERSDDFGEDLAQRVDAVVAFFAPHVNDAGEIEDTKLLQMLYLLEMGRDTLNELENAGRIRAVPPAGATVVPLFPRGSHDHDGRN